MDSEETKNNVCIACKNTLRLGASKCSHCETYQNWRRHVSTWGPVVSLFLGLSAVISLGAPQVSYLLSPKYDYSIQKISEGFRHIVIRVENNGTEDIFIGQIATYFPRGEGILKSSSNEYLIPGKSSKLLQLEWDNSCSHCTQRPQDLGVITFNEETRSRVVALINCGLAITLHLGDKEDEYFLDYQSVDDKRQHIYCDSGFNSFLRGEGGFG